LSAASGFGEDRLTPYTYKDTQDLVALVEDAAALIEAQGEAAFKEFAKRDSKWLHGESYLFVYYLDGTTAFHPITPELVGKNVIDLKDMNGKPIIREITDIGKEPSPAAHGWVFYLWQNQTQLTPSWKGSYIRKAIAPDHKTYVVGSGLYNIKVEKRFVEQRVRMAGELLKTAGKTAAFKEFQDPASPFVFLDSYIFVLNEKGETLVDPAFPTMTGRNLLEFRDEVGFLAIKEVIAKLAHADETWVQYLWPKPGSAVPTRKVIYARRIKVGDETLIVGSDFFLATPIWMRVEDDHAWRQNLPG
jgi:signal transduction histidine kinase